MKSTLSEAGREEGNNIDVSKLVYRNNRKDISNEKNRRKTVFKLQRRCEKMGKNEKKMKKK